MIAPFTGSWLFGPVRMAGCHLGCHLCQFLAAEPVVEERGVANVASMDVGAQREARVGVPEPRRDLRRGVPALEQQRRERVPQRVQRRLHARALDGRAPDLAPKLEAFIGVPTELGKIGSPSVL